MSLSTNQIKFLSNLGKKKFRDEHELFVVEGVKMVEEAIHQSRISIESIYAVNNWIGKNGFLLNDNSLEIIEIKEKELARISNLKNPNQVFCVCKQRIETESQIEIEDLTLFLDRIRDPGNMGTILRIADWFGIEKVILSPECVEIYNPKVVQASMGAIFRIQVLEKDFENLYEENPNAQFFATTLAGKNVFTIEKPKLSVLIIGNESHGIAPEILEKVDDKISIPAPKNNRSESLNAAIATGIICSVFRN